jgi:tRNA threonylcarbamoyladenosine biosynthesis protein TsaB
MASSSRILGVDTAGPEIAVALVEGEARVRVESAPGGRQGAPRLAELLDRVLDDASDLAAVAVCTGPGPFTALRIGLAATFGLGLARRLPVLGVPSVEALSAVLPPGTLPVMDAGRGQVWVRLPGDAVCTLRSPEELAKALSGSGPPRLVGPGASRHREELVRLLGPEALPEPGAGDAAVGAARRAAAALAAGESLPVRPVYPRPPDAVPHRVS